MSDDVRMTPVYVLGFVLIVVLLLSNVVIAADRTALDSEHTIETFGEENVYDDVTATVQADTVERVNETIEAEKEARIEEQVRNRDLSERQEEFTRQQIADRFPDRAQQKEFVEGAVTSGFIERELTRNLEIVYAVLHGEQSDGQIAVRIGDQRDQLNESIRETLQDDPQIDEREIVATISGDIPDEENITEGGDVPSGVEGASAGAGLVRTLSWLLPLGVLGLVAGMFHFTGQDLRRTARSGGIGFAIAGILGAAIGFGLGTVATGAAESAVDADSPEVSAMSDGIVAVVDSLFGAIVMQGLLIAAVGLIAIGAVIAEQRGYFDDLLNDDQPAQQGQYQQGQYNQQYQQGQQQDGQQYQQGQQEQYNHQGQYNQQRQDQDGQQYDQRQDQDGQRGQGRQTQQNQYQDAQQGQHRNGQQPGHNQSRDGPAGDGQETTTQEQSGDEDQSNQELGDGDEAVGDGEQQD